MGLAEAIKDTSVETAFSKAWSLWKLLMATCHLWLFDFVSLYAWLRQGQSVQALAQP